MSPFLGLFDSNKDLQVYYQAMAGGLPRIAAVYIRKVIRAIGYDILVPMVCKQQVDEIKALFPAEAPLEWNWICKLIPTDFVVSIPDRLYGSQVSGNYDIADLISIEDGKVVLKNRKTIFRDILLNYIINSEKNYVGDSIRCSAMVRDFMELRGAIDVASLYKQLVIREFITASTFSTNIPGYGAHFVTHQYEEIDNNLKIWLTFYKQIIVEKTLIGEHTLGSITDWSHITRLMDRLSHATLSQGSEVDNLKEFLQKFRLDIEFKGHSNPGHLDD
jgi:hypothetical protein